MAAKFNKVKVYLPCAAAINVYQALAGSFVPQLLLEGDNEATKAASE